MKDRLGPYVISELLGEGGMGAVYRARHEDLKREVALKVLHPGIIDARDGAARFQREMRLASRLRHPNLVAVYDGGAIDGTPYLAMELVDGETLERPIARARLDWPRAAHIAKNVAEGLAYLHANEIVHRDIKPSNVMMGADGTIRILDFGLARQLDSTRVTEAGAFVGTLRYVAPEVFRGEDPTAATDLYALGCVIHELVSATPRVQAASPQDHIRKVLAEPAVLAPDLLERVPASLAALLAQLLEREPERRPESARALAEELACIALEAAVPGTDVTQRLRTSSRSRRASGAQAGATPRELPVAAPRRAVALAVAAALMAAGLLAMWLSGPGARLADDTSPAPVSPPGAAAAAPDLAGEAAALAAALERYRVDGLVQKLVDDPKYERGMTYALIQHQGLETLTLTRGRRLRGVSPRSKWPSALKQAALGHLEREPFWATLRTFRPRAAAFFADAAIPDELKLRLYRAVLRLGDVDLLLVGQRGETLDLQALTDGLVRVSYALIDPASARLPVPGEQPLFQGMWAWVIRGYDTWGPLIFWASSSEEFHVIWPGAKINTREEARSAFQCERRAELPEVPGSARGGQAVLRAELLIPSLYTLELEIRSDSGDLPLLIRQPGTETWLRAMDGLEPDPAHVPNDSGPRHHWGEVRLAFPARLIPRGPCRVRVTYRLPRGPRPDELSTAQQAAFLRALGISYR